MRPLAAGEWRGSLPLPARSSPAETGSGTAPAPAVVPPPSVFGETDRSCVCPDTHCRESRSAAPSPESYPEPAPCPHDRRNAPRPCWWHRRCNPSRPASGLALPTSHDAIRPTAPSRQNSSVAAATADAVWLSAVCRAIALDAAIDRKVSGCTSI